MISEESKWRFLRWVEGIVEIGTFVSMVSAILLAGAFFVYGFSVVTDSPALWGWWSPIVFIAGFGYIATIVAILETKYTRNSFAQLVCLAVANLGIFGPIGLTKLQPYSELAYRVRIWPLVILAAYTVVMLIAEHHKVKEANRSARQAATQAA